MWGFFINTAKKKNRKWGDQGNGTYLDHDIRALINGRHDRYGFLWLMQLTIGEKREMGRCEKECADFKQQKADHRFCLPN